METNNLNKETLLLLNLAEKVAIEAGEYLMNCIGQVGIREKGPRDLVTDADIGAQELIQRRLLDACPNHAFLGEESVENGEWRTGYCWVVDPIDGTTNFAHRMPGFSVSIGLFHEGHPIAGVVRDPFLKETFSATKQGSWLNGVRVQASRCVEVSRSLLVCSFPSVVTPCSNELAQFSRVVQQASVRRHGSAALNLCYVGCGRFDGYWASSLKIWDLAAGMLFAMSGGAVVSQLDGGPLDFENPRFLVSSTAALHSELLPILQI